MIKKINYFFNNHKLIFLGFLLFSLYFWGRFLRSRTSKVLPLNLSILGFFTLSYTCAIFLYIIICLLFPRKSNDIIEKIIDWIFTPIAEFDKFLKTRPRIKNFYMKGLHYLLPKLNFLIIETNLLFIILWIFPRIILLFVLYLDVFHFHKLHYKYYFVCLGLFLFLNRYLKYSFKSYKNQLIETNKPYIYYVQTPYISGIHPSELAPDYDPNDPDEQDDIEIMSLPFEIFIKFQIESMVYQGITRRIESTSGTRKLYELLWEKYIGQPYIFYSGREDVPKDYKNIFGENTPENYFKAQDLLGEKSDEFIIQAMKNIMEISLLYEYYNKTSNHNEKIKTIKILIYISYLLCWLYVLIISIHTLDMEELIKVLNNTWLGIENPFN